MRAARALDMLFILQRQGRATAAELASQLEVSERTVRRDVEVLGEAGVPIYTVQGPGGGIELLDTFRTRLTSLTDDELRVLFLAGQPRLAQRLGFGAPARTVREKLLGALSPGLAEAAGGLGTWFLHDPDPWQGNQMPHGELRRLARCINERREVEVTIAKLPVRLVRPLGLVLKAGAWYLVHDTMSQGNDVAGAAAPAPVPAPVHHGTAATARGVLSSVATMPLAGLRGTRITRARFERPPGFNLDTYWRNNTDGHVGHQSQAAASGTAPTW